MGDRIDSKIEDHRRDPDPHPRWKKAIDAHFTEIEETIALLTPGGEVPVIPDAGTATPQPVAHGVPAQAGSAAPFSREDHRHALVLPPSVEAIANITGTGVVQRDNAGALRAIQQAIGLVGVWDADGMSSRPKLTWNDATTTLEPQNAFTLDNVETDHYGRGTISVSAGWLWTAAWGESMGGYWLRDDYTVEGNRTVTVAYGATIGGGDCGFSLKLFLGQPAGTPKHTIDFPLGRFRIFQDQDTLYVYNATGDTLWSRLLPTVAGGEPEEFITIAVTAEGAAAVVYADGVQVATGAATAGTATGATITFTDSGVQYRTCGFCELTTWGRLPNAADLLAAKLRTHPVAGSTPDRLVIGSDADLRVLDHAGTGTRLLAADTDGDYAPVAAVVWTGTWLQINAKDVAAVDTNGLVARTAAGTFASRTVTGPAAGITVTNGDGVAGNPTLALANDLAALEGLSGTGLMARTGDGTASTRAVAVTSGHLSVANGDGVAGNPTLGLPDVGAGAGSVGAADKAVSFTTDAQGRVTARSEQAIAITPAQAGADPAGTAAAAIVTHVAVSDPHTQYRLESVAVPWGDLSGVPSTFAPSAHASSHASGGGDPVTLAQSQVTNLTTDLAAKAPLASPALTGNPTAPTPATGDNDTSIATTAFVNAEIAADAAPLSHVGAGGSAHAAATTSVDGFMSSADKTKLDGVATGANNYVHPNHTGDVTSTGDGATAIAAGVIVDADVNASAAIGWAKISKTSSSLADLATRSAADLSSGTLPAARMPALTGDVTTSAGAVATAIATGVVTNAKLANMAANSIKGNNTASIAAPLDLTVAQVKTLLAYTAADISAVPTSRTVTAGTGLTGGGALSADITLTVSYGTTGTTACAGNDSRLSDARAPTSHSIESHTSSNVTTLNVDDTKHGLFPKLPSVSDGKYYGIKDGAVAEVAASITLSADREVNADKPPASSDSRLRGPFTINYIKNPDGEEDTGDLHAGYVEYADAAGTQPVDGTGGSPVSVLHGYSDTGLRGSRSFKFTKVTGASRQGEGFSYDFTIDAADKNRSLTVAFECLLNGAGYTAGDMSVWVYDVTNSRLCPISANSIAGPGRFVAHFSTGDSASYRLCMHVASTVTGEWQMRFDDFYIGPMYLPSVPAMSDRQDGGAITITATTTNPTKGTIIRDKVQWRRIGDSAEFLFDYGQTASGGAAGSGDYLYTLPAGLSFDGSKVAFYTGSLSSGYTRGIGTGWYDGYSGVYYAGPCVAVPYDSTRFRLLLRGDNTSHQVALGYSSSGGIGPLSSQTGFSIQFTAPIAGWSGSTAVQPGSRYLWAQRFAATAVRVTTTPSKPGEYRARRGGADTTPTTGPTTADGFRIDSGSAIAAGRINQYDIYVGPGKIVAISPYASAARAGSLAMDHWYGGAHAGAIQTYDQATGIVSIYCYVSGADQVGQLSDTTQITTGYFDILVADDPVPVSLAPAVHVEASSDAGQVLTADVTNVNFEDEQIDTHGAWNGAGVFAAPVAGVYLVACCLCSSSGAHLPMIYRNGTLILEGNYQGTTGQRAEVVASVRLSAGDTISIRNHSSVTLDASAVRNWLRITRIGDA